MKRRLLVGSVLWTVLVTFLHVWANVGFATLWQELRTSVGLVRPTLRVGFLGPFLDDLDVEWVILSDRWPRYERHPPLPDYLAHSGVAYNDVILACTLPLALLVGDRAVRRLHADTAGGVVRIRRPAGRNSWGRWKRNSFW